MSIEQFFPVDYPNSRQMLADAAQAAGVVTSRSIDLIDAKGPGGEPLAIDVVRFKPDAPKQIMIVSGSHGVEGLCGAGCQIGLLQERLHERLAADTGLVLVHALNPYGYAWLRRVNEDNVDLNRNFHPHATPLPSNANYDALHQWIVPSDWDEERMRCDLEIQKWIAGHGFSNFKDAVSGGQYGHPDGLFYGGTQKVWSHTALELILDEVATPSVTRLIVLDLHTGLGVQGEGQLLDDGAKAAEQARIRDWFGGVSRTDSGSSISSEISGSLGGKLRSYVSGDRATYVALEYGTLDPLSVYHALRADNWFHVKAKSRSAHGIEIKRAIRDAFFIDTPDWKVSVFALFRYVFLQACRV